MNRPPSEPLRARLGAFSPAFAVSGLVLAVIFGMLPQPLARVEQSNFLELAASIQDDSFYYLLPAFHFKSKRFFTVDGYSPSYGFEPGYELLLSAYAIFFDDFQSFMRGAMTLGLLTHALTSLMIALLVLRAADAQAAPVRWIQYAAAAGAGSFYLTRGTVLLSSMTCKENILASFLLAVLLLLVTQSMPTSERRGRCLAALCGFGIAALLLSRVLPTTFASSVVIAGAALARWRNPWSFITALFVPLALWSAYALFAFGHVVPTSVRVKVMSEAPWHTSPVAPPWTVLVSLGIDYLRASLAFAVGVHSQLVIMQKDSALVVLWSRFEFLWIAIGLLALVLVMFTGLGRFVKAYPSPGKCLRGTGAVVPVLALLTTVILAMYVVQGGLIAMRRPEELFYYTWYVYDLPVLVAASMGTATVLGLGFLEGHANRLITTRTLTARSLLAVGFWAVAVIAIVVMLAVRVPREYGRIQDLRPYTEFDTQGRGWQHTIIRAGLFLKNSVTLHGGDRVACISCGVLGVLLPGHILNIDGLASDAAARHLLARPPTLDEYVLQVRPRYYIDIDIPLLRDPRIHVRALQVFEFVYKGGYLVAELQYEQ
jgi:hypothetical protein